MNSIIHGDCVFEMGRLKAESVDLVVTSPPYDDLRAYTGYKFDAEEVLAGLLRVVKPGGVVVWVVADQTIKGGRTGNSFRQALRAQEMGFTLYDVIIWQKPNTPFTHPGRYTNCHEYIFVFSKGKPKTFNALKEPKVRPREPGYRPTGDTSGRKYQYTKEKKGNSSLLKTRTNVWRISVGCGSTAREGVVDHPAKFPSQLAEDCVNSWSNAGDLVLDPMCGSGTTCLAAQQLGRQWIGMDISEKYCQLARDRLAAGLV